VREAEGPDETILPIVPVVVIAFLLFVVFMIRRMWAQFWERSIEPVAAEVGETWDGVEAKATGAMARIKAWLNSWKRKG
jgi:cell division protein FtsW (lipid II flippase)